MVTCSSDKLQCKPCSKPNDNDENKTKQNSSSNTHTHTHTHTHTRTHTHTHTHTPTHTHTTDKKIQFQQQQYQQQKVREKRFENKHASKHMQNRPGSYMYMQESYCTADWSTQATTAKIKHKQTYMYAKSSEKKTSEENHMLKRLFV